MTAGSSAQTEDDRRRDRDRLSRLPSTDLVALVERLQATVARQEALIARQGAAIAALQGRGRQAEPGLSSSPASPSDGVAVAGVGAAPARPSSRPTARPVPGADFTIVFDGGSIGNPGRGYGSYQTVGRDGGATERRLEYGTGITNNQAEYRTLVHALEDLAVRLGVDAAQTSIAVRGDSRLVIEQVGGRWKVKHPELQPLQRRAVELLRGFARSDVAWHPRQKSVRVLGH